MNLKYIMKYIEITAAAFYFWAVVCLNSDEMMLLLCGMFSTVRNMPLVYSI